MAKKTYTRHFEDTVTVSADPETVFSYADDPRNFSSHMNKSSMMMAGGSMKTETDEGKGQKVGSHIRMNGTVLGINLFLDEVITRHEPPYRKEWQTVGDINLIVIDHYKLGFEINPENKNSRLRVYIDYDFPKSRGAHVLGYLFGEMYAKWCVGQMIKGTRERFTLEKRVNL